MSPQSRIFLLAAGLILAALPVWAKPPLQPHKSASVKAAKETVIIENSGSTNTTGYQIVVTSDASASVRETGARGGSPLSSPTPRVQALSHDITTKLFADLAAAGPLASLPIRHVMRSVSFGTSTFINYKGQRSPDLTSPASPQAQALHDDILAITRTLHTANNARFPISHPTLP